ncbi:hypothetical protein ACTFIZ_011184 [Dictyostelium cf. discoideum]
MTKFINRYKHSKFQSKLRYDQTLNKIQVVNCSHERINIRDKFVNKTHTNKKKDNQVNLDYIQEREIHKVWYNKVINYDLFRLDDKYGSVFILNYTVKMKFKIKN